MQNRDLTKGSILKNILIVSVPIIVGNLIGMLYNFTDMYWISKVGTAGVSAVGTTALFIWLGSSYIILAALGGQIKVSHAIGHHDSDLSDIVAAKTLKLAGVLSLIYGAVLFLFSNQIIDFFKLGDPLTIQWASQYLQICGIFIVFLLMNQAFSAVYNGMGNTSLVLKIMAVGILLNVVLDPLFIVVFDMKVVGAALATLIGAVVSTLIFAWYTYKNTNVFSKFKMKRDFTIDKEIIKLGFLPMVQNMLFAGIAIVITRYISTFGDEAIAIQKVGSDIESLTWMIGIGISTAVSVFVGQNFAAKEFQRIQQGSRIILWLMTGYGLLITFTFLTCSAQIYSIFFTDAHLISLGEDYLGIVGVSQLFMIYEAVFTGIFNGYGKTNIAPFFSISGNLARLPLAVILTPYFGLNGIWIAISISAVYKGIGMTIAYIVFRINQKKIKN